MNRAKPVAVCISLAMAAHAALLLQGARGTGRQPAVPANGAVSVRLQPAEPAAVIPSEATPAPAAEAPSAVPEVEPAKPAQAAGAELEVPPVFADGLPAIGFPDAPLPTDGADVRAYVMSDAQGTVSIVATSAPPQLPTGFQKMVELGLRQARLQTSQPTAYCLLVKFDAAAPTPTLAWLPGAAKDAARCLAGALPAPREIVVPEAAAS